MSDMPESRTEYDETSPYHQKEHPLRQLVENHYRTLYRQVHEAGQKKAREILRHQIEIPPPPRPLILPIPSSDPSENDKSPTVSVIVADGTNKKLQTDSTAATLMPTLPVVRELISYVPTMKNVATRGHLIGIPYLGDQFDADDQHLINSISAEPTKQTKLIRKKKLDDPSLDQLYQNLRSDPQCSMYSSDELIDAILYYHRDTSPRPRLLALAHQMTHPTPPDWQRNIDLCETIDADIAELLIPRWCARFCPRCYSYNCLLHNEGPCHLPLPKRFSLQIDKQPSERCSVQCYKQRFEQQKRSLSPSSSHNADENDRKRVRLSSKSAEKDSESTKKCLVSIENRPIENAIPSAMTLTDRTLFRLFYILTEGDLCTISQFFSEPSRTCQDLYEEFILDQKYFSERLSTNEGQTCRIRHPYRRQMPEGSTRAFLLYMKKTLNRSQSTSNQRKSSNESPTLKAAYQPCLHEGPCTAENRQCRCMQNGTFCEKFCHCPRDCPHRFPGCACKGSCLFNNCLCTAEGRECDSDLCHNCGASAFSTNLQDPNEMIFSSTTALRNVRSRTSSRALESSASKSVLPAPQRRANSRASLSSNVSSSSSSIPVISCANVFLQRKLHKQVLIAESDVAGYGAFLGSAIAHPGDLIAEYTGEIITEEEADRRGRLYDKRACSYLFNLDTQHCIDARQFGNKLRFANHSSKPNCVPKIKLVNGDYRIGVYAKEVIFQGDELFFEYMYDAHQLQQFVNNERVDEAEQENFTILKRYPENFMLVQPSYD